MKVDPSKRWQLCTI